MVGGLTAGAVKILTRTHRMASVSFRKIEKAYGKVKVIHGIGFDIADGEFVVLVGPSRAAARARCCACWPGWRRSPAARS
jgi:hypothetical protein